MKYNHLENAKSLVDTERMRMAIFKSAVINIVIFIVLAFLTLAVSQVLIGIVIIDGSSMYPGLHSGDVVLYNKFVTCTNNELAIAVTENVRVVKRVIATPGQKVDIDFISGTVMVDGVALDEPYIIDKTTPKYEVDFPQIVPEGKFFLLGDNRRVSLDSRSAKVGMVDEKDILGRVFFQFRTYGF